MPSLDPDQRAALIKPVGQCGICGFTRVRNYCRSCDEFYLSCGCQLSTGHEGHRLYVWLNGQVIAEPDFDHLVGRR